MISVDFTTTLSRAVPAFEPGDQSRWQRRHRPCSSGGLVVGPEKDHECDDIYGNSMVIYHIYMVLYFRLIQTYSKCVK